MHGVEIVQSVTEFIQGYLSSPERSQAEPDSAGAGQPDVNDRDHPCEELITLDQSQ
jgi:hypothetical protein